MPGIHLIATDSAAKAEERWVSPAGRDIHAIGLRIYGSLAYAPPGVRFEKVSGYHVGGSGFPHKGQKGVTIENSVAVISTRAKYAATLSDCKDDPVKHPRGCSWSVGDDRAKSPVIARNLTLVGPRQRPTRISKDWKRERLEILAWGQDVDIYLAKGGVGAALCHRYVDGRETPLPLWPWPMQERIREATERSNWATADVMGEVEAMFGAPPAECTSEQNASL
jgi:hypothetical protein